jgi:hypothetical protein
VKVIEAWIMGLDIDSSVLIDDTLGGDMVGVLLYQYLEKAVQEALPYIPDCIYELTYVRTYDRIIYIRATG